jgi:hypothetical protein
MQMTSKMEAHQIGANRVKADVADLDVVQEDGKWKTVPGNNQRAATSAIARGQFKTYNANPDGE